MRVHDSHLVVSVRFDRVWVGKARGTSRSLFVSQPGKNTISGGNRIGEIAVWYSWMNEGETSSPPQVEIKLLTIGMADGRTQQIANQEIVYLNLHGIRTLMYPTTILIGNLLLKYEEVESWLQPYLHLRRLREPISLPRFSLRWSGQPEVLSDGYVSLPQVYPREKMEQLPEEIQLVAKVARSQAEWDDWLNQLEGELWEAGKKRLQATIAQRQRQEVEAAELRRIQQEAASRPKWETKVINQLEEFFQKSVTKSEQKQSAALLLVVKRGTRAVYVVYRLGKSPSVYLFDKTHADQANSLTGGQIHPGTAAKYTISGRAIRKVGRVTLVQATTHHVIRYLAGSDK